MLDEQLKCMPAFFASQLAANPALATKAKLHSILKVIELERANMLAGVKSEHIHVKLLTDKLPFALQSPIWYVAYWVPSQPFDAVVAPDGDSFLWLDNHLDDTDFVSFLAKEEIPLDNPLDLAVFLLETKFRYLTLGFDAKVVGGKSDIPLWYELPPEHRVGLEDYLEEKAVKLDNISRLIAPPSLEKRSDAIHLVFFIWTLVFGNIYKLDCTLGNNSSFIWSGKSLGHDIGKSFGPK